MLKIGVSRQVLVAIVGIVILTSVIQALAPPGGLAERRRDTARDIPRDVADIVGQLATSLHRVRSQPVG